MAINKKIIILFYILKISLLNTHAYSAEYSCPKLPFFAKLNEKVEKNWTVKYANNAQINLFKRTYESYFKKTYIFQSWDGLNTYGWPEKSRYLLECCNISNKNTAILCVRRYVKAKKCFSLLAKTKLEKFKCLK